MITHLVGKRPCTACDHSGHGCYGSPGSNCMGDNMCSICRGEKLVTVNVPVSGLSRDELNELLSPFGGGDKGRRTP
jgi:hypothetical protein